MCWEEKIEVWDEEQEKFKPIPIKDLEDQLEKIRKLLEKCLEKLKVENYDLNSIEVGLSLKAGIFVITAEGSIKLTYNRK